MSFRMEESFFRLFPSEFFYAKHNVQIEVEKLFTIFYDVYEPSKISIFSTFL